LWLRNNARQEEIKKYKDLKQKKRVVILSWAGAKILLDALVPELTKKKKQLLLP
jgi:hypothetical protein